MTQLPPSIQQQGRNEEVLEQALVYRISCDKHAIDRRIWDIAS